MTIIWTEEANKIFNQILNYLDQRFTAKETTAFYYSVERITVLLKTDPYIYPKSKISSVRRIKIHRLTTLYFEINTNKNEVVLLNFHQNRQNPDSISFNK